MRLSFLFFASLLPLAACGGGGGDFVDGGADTPRVDSVSPPYGPLSGGSTIIITGNGFLQNGAAPNNVLIGGRMAAAAGAIDDNTIEVVLPEADSPGDAEIVVYNSNGYASATGVFAYSEQPTIDSMTPEEVRYDEGGTITLTGSGFVDEDAGVNTVLIDGIPAVDVVVESDTELTFTALPGVVFNEPVITVINRRGAAADTGYQYGPGPAGGLIGLLRPTSGLAPTRYAVFFDPLTLELQVIPAKAMAGGGGGSFPYFRTIFLNSTGQYLGVDHETNQVRMLDLDQQTSTLVTNTIGFNYTEGVMVGGTAYGITSPAQCNDKVFGSIDLSTGVFTRIGTAVLSQCGGGSGIAADAGGTVYVYFNGSLATISRTTGTLGTPVSVSLGQNMTGMRFLGNTLYAVTQGGQIVTINTTTGVTDLVATYSDNTSWINSLETVQ